MSDYTVEERLEGCRRELLKDSIFFCVGWFLLILMAGGVIHLGRGLIGGLGWFIIGGPRIWKAMIGGFGAALKPDYEVVTTYGDGRKESDGGTESIQMNFIARLIMIAVFALIGGLITIIHLFILTIKYIALHLQAKPKPVFVKSGLLIIVINIAVVIGSLLIVMTVQSVESAVADVKSGTKVIGGFESKLTEANDGRVITKYKGKGGDVVIPDEIDGLPVVGISGVKIFNEVNISQITLPKTLKYIENYAFAESDIASIVIPEGVTDIGSWAFQDCKNLVSITLPQSLQRIGSGAFANCTSLTNVTIPSEIRIRHGSYDGGYVDAFHFKAEQYKSSSLNHHTFNGCSKLSAASRQAIQASGYDGDF